PSGAAALAVSEIVVARMLTPPATPTSPIVALPIFTWLSRSRMFPGLFSTPGKLLFGQNGSTGPVTAGLPDEQTSLNGLSTTLRAVIAKTPLAPGALCTDSRYEAATTETVGASKRTSKVAVAPGTILVVFAVPPGTTIRVVTTGSPLAADSGA